jgi:hypothetical protein
MAFNLIQAGTNLYSVNAGGVASAALTLPSGVALASNLIPRFARFKNYVVVVNTPSRPLSVDTLGVVRLLTPDPPSAAPVLSGSAGGSLTGAYVVKVTNVYVDGQGNLIAESDYSALSNLATVRGQYLQAANVATSPDAAVSARRLYRTTDNGSVFFDWIDLTGNLATTLIDDRSDASLGVIGADPRGSAPDLTLIAEWYGRLWGVSRTDYDNLRYTEAEAMYAWFADNSIPISHVGDDRFGITALAPRRDALGVGRRNQLTSISSSDGVAFLPTVVTENCGILSQESVVVFRDAAYFIWLDGVYRWDANGIACVSDMGNVRSWFVTDDYFNRGMFSLAFAVFDPINIRYRLFLCSAGNVVPDRWVEFDINSGKWYGPHKTDAFSPRCGFQFRGVNDQSYLTIGSYDGYLSLDTEVRTDWGSVPIVEDVTSAQFSGGDPNRDTVFGKVYINTEPLAASVLTPPVLNVTTQVGELNLESTIPASAVAMQADLTKARQSLFRVGEGKHAVVRLQNSQIGVNPVVYGMKIPTTDVGQR